MTLMALILEDSETQAAIIAKMIQSRGNWQTAHCSDVRGAMDILQSVQIDAMFLDIFVGERNTLKHFDRFRLLGGDTPITLMTAGSKAEIAAETLKKARLAGADYVLAKPFGITAVQAILDSFGTDGKTRRKHVLIVDDSPTVCRFANDILEAAGYRTSIAGSMEEAFGNIDIARVDAVLCDVFLPGMGGLKGMRLIRGNWPRIRIVSMSAGMSDKISSLDALNATRKIGVDGQIDKPFDGEDLLAVMQAVLSFDEDPCIPADDGMIVEL